MMGLLVLLKDHGGAEDLALLADDLELELDEILPSVEFAEALGFLAVSEGRAVMTEPGKALLSGTIKTRRSQLRERLQTLKLFSQILKSLESSPGHRLTGDMVFEIVSRISLPSDDAVKNVINWGRFTNLFHYDAEENVLLPSRSRTKGKAPLPNAGV
jgi:NitT/TauT family transport system ATP-binding protein